MASSLTRFRTFETDRFHKDLEQDFSVRQKHIKTKLTTYVYPQLRENPFFSKNIEKLINYKPDTWCYRIGGFRFFYEIAQQQKKAYMIADHNWESTY